MSHNEFPQICSICGNKEAVIFVKIVTGDKVEEKGLCASCAVKYLEKKEDIKELSLVDEKLLSVIEEMKDLLAGIVANISAISVIMNSKKTEPGLKCGHCGLSYENFKETGYLGCSNCYSTFKEYIDEFVFELERGSYHRGKMPEKYARLHKLKKEIRQLSNQLKHFVRNEEYEKAEKIRRRLDKLTGNQYSGREDENH